MTIAPDTRKTLDTFFRKLKNARSRLLLLDYDGTLAPFRPEREQAVPYSGVTERLKALIAAKNTRLIIISGRWSRDLKPLLKLDVYPEIWGCHGAERLYPDGTSDIISLEEKTIKGLVIADEWAKSEGLEHLAEKKPTSLAFHWRGQKQNLIEVTRGKIISRWQTSAPKYGLALQEFDGGLEIRAADINKGYAVKTLLRETPVDAAIAYLGDDLTDEDAFLALKNRSLKILVRPQYRDTAADIHLVPPEELLLFLDNWLKNTR